LSAKPENLELIGPAVVRGQSLTKGFATADAVEFFAQLSSTTAVVASNLTLLFTPDNRGYSKFNRSAIRF